MERDWLSLAKSAHESSTTYVDANYRKKWEDGLRMFQSKHPQGSKYLTDAYKHRSKLFRPKSRSLSRKHEAAAAAAFFSNVDVISTAAVNKADKNQAASASLMQEILNHRLSKTIPWFQLVTGGMQDAMTVGVVCSYQYWKYETEQEISYAPAVDEFGMPIIDESGQVQMQEQRTETVRVDEPCVELIPVENIRIDPGANWTNPVKSSPYVIRMIPMYACDVKAMMRNNDAKTGAPKWKELTDAQIRSSRKNENDSTAQTRDGNRQDSKDQSNAPIDEFEIVWVHENFMRIDGREVVYFTLGTEFMLTDPVPLKQAYFHGERPIVMGACVIETHKIMPDSPIILGEQLQREANEVANQRIDNVKLVLNKRYIVRRGAQVDLKSLVRNVPASITLANDPSGDVHPIEFSDVTSSSYAEQDRINVDYDELTGNFSQGSVMTNRKMGETVGGMGMISNAANQVTEYSIRVFTETWVEPVLRQLVKLEQKYETNETILAIAASQAKLLERYGISTISDELLNQELTLTVNVGMGATDPQQKLGKFMAALTAYANVSSMQLPHMDMNEVGKEVFGLAGYRDGQRFMVDAEQNNVIQRVIEQAQQMVQQAQSEVAQQQQQMREKEIRLALDRLQVESKQQSMDANQQVQDARMRFDTASIEASKEQMRLFHEDLWKDLEAKTKVLVAQISASSKPDAQNTESDLNTAYAEFAQAQQRLADMVQAMQEAQSRERVITTPDGRQYSVQLQ